MFHGRVEVVNTKSGWSAMSSVITFWFHSWHLGYGRLSPITSGTCSVVSGQPIFR